MKRILIIILLGFTSCETVSLSKTENVELVSEIVEVEIDYSKMPPYCNPKSYKILKTSYGYVVQLPHGTTYGDFYNTPKEAQQKINELASRSMERWIKSHGTDFFEYR